MTAAPAPIRLLLLDDHEIVRDGLSSIIAQHPDLEIAAEARTAEQALLLLEQHRPDVAIVDLRLPGMGGAEFIARAREASPSTRFVVLTTYDADQDILEAFRAGAHAYILKDSFRNEIIATIRAVYEGQTLVPQDIAERLKSRSSGLSPRELEVLSLVARGESNKLIAVALAVSEATVKTHLLRIYEKLGVSDRTAAVTAALARGMLRL
jgi:DNA-binding NarL/FixJ family response regulator